jgi:hypothetical protein
MKMGRWAGAALVSLTVLVAANCKTDPNAPPNPGDVVVTPDSVLLFIGNAQQFTASLTGGAGSTRATFSWSTGDPTVATVSATGLVTAVGKGKTVVIATTIVAGAPKTGTAIVQVADPSGSACTGVDTLQAWSGSLTATWNDNKTSGTQTTDIKQQLTVDFKLLKQGLVRGVVTYTGKPTGTAVLDEKITDNSSGQVSTNAGNGPVVTINDLSLKIDTDACTWHFSYDWGVNAVANGTPKNPEQIAAVSSKEVPLGIWQQGISHSTGFPAYMINVPPPPLTDQYLVASIFGAGLFADAPTQSRGDAPVDFTASPSAP